jgi:hypothetical protein
VIIGALLLVSLGCGCDSECYVVIMGISRV